MNRIFQNFFGATAVLAAASLCSLSANAADATFAAVNDTVVGFYLNSATTAPDPASPNTLVFGLHSGFSGFASTEFRASATSGATGFAMDTITFQITAPAGYYIERVTYNQTVSASTSGAGSSTNARTDLSVGGIAVTATQGSGLPTSSKIVDLAALRLSRTQMTVVPTLTARAGLRGSAGISLTYAAVSVTLAPL
jgi:hypothetical protein